MTDSEFLDTTHLAMLQQARALLKDILHGEDAPHVPAEQLAGVIGEIRAWEKTLEARLKVRQARTKPAKDGQGVLPGV